MKEFIVNSFVRLAIRITVKLDRESRNEFKKVPLKGPGLIITNHMSNIEGPVYYTSLRPRKTVALGKEELWQKGFTRIMMEAWNVIPISRSGVDQKAIASCLETLEKGDFLCVAPEGTRSRDGKLHKAKPGVTLFVRPEVPLIPMAVWGLEDYGSNLKKFRRTTMKVRVGEPFYATRPKGRFTAEKRQEMADSFMEKIAALLPEEYRGYYERTAEES
jgi:1-acyl-sn-glycerol-3-phosphate acyltransferase